MDERTLEGDAASGGEPAFGVGFGVSAIVVGVLSQSELRRAGGGSAGDGWGGGDGEVSGDDEWGAFEQAVYKDAGGGWGLRGWVNYVASSLDQRSEHELKRASSGCSKN
jgi:hypothetical protein